MSRRKKITYWFEFAFFLVVGWSSVANFQRESELGDILGVVVLVVGAVYVLLLPPLKFDQVLPDVTQKRIALIETIIGATFLIASYVVVYFISDLQIIAKFIFVLLGVIFLCDGMLRRKYLR